MNKVVEGNSATSRAIVSQTMQRTHDFFIKEMYEDSIKIYKGPVDCMLDNSSIKDASVFMTSSECMEWLMLEWVEYVWKNMDICPWDPSISSAKDYARTLFMHADHIKHTYRTIVNLIRSYGLMELHSSPKKEKPFQRTMIRVAGTTGLIGKHGNINMKDSVVDFNIQKWIDSINIESVPGEKNQAVAVINILADMFVHKEIQLKFGSDCYNMTLLELHLFYYFQSNFMDAMIHAMILNGLKYGDILYFFNSQYRFVFKNKTSQYASFVRYDIPITIGSLILSSDKKKMLRTLSMNVHELQLIDNDPYQFERGYDSLNGVTNQHTEDFKEDDK